MIFGTGRYCYMAILEILKYPDPKLKLVAKPVVAFDIELQTLAQNMLETMYYHEGIGLAANQINVQTRIFVLDLSDNKDQSLCVVNPRIKNANGEMLYEEGCLSFPNVYAKIKRNKEVELEYFDLQGNMQTLVADGLLAICIQHEIDHLDGITFFDRLSSLKQKLLRRKLKVGDKIE